MTFGSASVAAILIELLRQWARATAPGTVTGPDGGYTIFPWAAGDVRMPDVAYISRKRLPRVPRRGWVAVVPEFVAEVVSPNDRITDAEDKAQDYIRAGVSLVWVVVPSTESVHVWRADGSRAVLRVGQRLTGEQVLPGFELPVADLFAEFEPDD
jgi:Uma2 family endonuclease